MRSVGSKKDSQEVICQNIEETEICVVTAEKLRVFGEDDTAESGASTKTLAAYGKI